jgi:single-stranded DNA-binding protein
MYRDFNLTIISGTLCANATVSPTNLGRVVYKFRIAVESIAADNTQRTEYKSVALYAKQQASYLDAILRKGRKVLLEGEHRTKQHEGRDYHEIAATTVKPLASYAEATGLGSESAPQAAKPAVPPPIPEPPAIPPGYVKLEFNFAGTWAESLVPEGDLAKHAAALASGSARIIPLTTPPPPSPPRPAPTISGGAAEAYRSKGIDLDTAGLPPLPSSADVAAARPFG